MAVCTYGNPKTMRSECWRDGRLIASYSSELYALKEWSMPPRLYSLSANIGDWKPGQLWGSADAMSHSAYK